MLREAFHLDTPTETIKALIFLAAIEMDSDAGAATRLLAKARTIADEEGFEPDPRSEGRLVEPTKESARARLGEHFEAEWDAGSRMTLEEAVTLARDKE